MLGIIGGGQLARMMVEAAVRLDVDVAVLAASPDDSAASIAPSVVLGSHDDVRAVDAFARSCDVLTFDHERTPPSVLDALDASGVVLRPGSAAMRRASDKTAQRDLASEVGLAVPPCTLVTGVDELHEVTRRLGLPLVAKAARGGYDGRGVRFLRTVEDVEHLASVLVTDGGVWIIERELAIETELAVQIARRPNGDVAVYPVVETVQRAGICTSVRIPARSGDRLAGHLAAAAHRLADRLGYVGVLAVEAFVVDGQLLLNELAPRPHNSGHHTIDACTTSQFENHIRAVLDLPLGDTSLLAPSAVMVNVIATGPTIASLRDIPVPTGTAIHLYGKQPRAGRKVGHVTSLGDADGSVGRLAHETAAALAASPSSHPHAVAHREVRA